MTRPDIILLLGSAPDVTRSEGWERSPFHRIVAINNAWRIRPDWDFLVHPEDFPEDRMPPDRKTRADSIRSASEYVPAQNAFGGFVYAGGTMSMTAAYWVLHRFRPDVIAFLGCDMIYEPNRGPTHFYGFGSADPLRDDVTLQNLKAKSARLFLHALRAGCVCLNLSELPESNLVFPRTTRDELRGLTNASVRQYVATVLSEIDTAAELHAIDRERSLGYFVESGEYWKQMEEFDAEELRKLDDLWLASIAGWRSRSLAGDRG